MMVRQTLSNLYDLSVLYARQHPECDREAVFQTYVDQFMKGLKTELNTTIGHERWLIKKL